MMATVPLTSSSLLPLLESLEDSAAGQSEQTDAYLTIANRLSGEDGRQFLPAVVKHFLRLGKTLQAHISSPNTELSQAALQALGVCLFNTHIVSAIPASFAEELLLSLSSLVVKSTDKNTCTRALWVISKQNFPPEVVAKKVREILRTLESVRTREDLQSIVMEHEALNVVIRLLEQAPDQMGEGAVRWAKLVIPLVVHSASKVRLRAAAALEMGMPLLLEKQQEVAAIMEPLLSTKLIPELQKLFSSKNETNVLKLWPLFVRLLGKMLHRGGPFINSLLHLEELGFRSSSPNIKKIAFIAWKSLIDNFALNPDILCSAKRLKLLMQPLASIQVRTEALLLTKLEVWWYLVVKLGPNLVAHFEQIAVPLLKCTLGPDLPIPATPSKSSNQSAPVGTSTPKAGGPAFSSPAVTPRMNLNSSVHPVQSFPSIQLLGLEMMLHYFLGPEVTAAVAKNKLVLNLEPLTHPFLSSPSSFTKHASLLISAVRDCFITIGRDAPDALLALIWKNLVSFVSTTIDAAGNKKERQGSEVLTLMLQALQSVVSSEALPAHKVLLLLESTVKGLPQRVLGSASYQVGKMDVLNGTPALFLILLFYNSSLVSAFVEDERFFLCLETLVSCGLSGPTSPLAFGEAVLGAMGRCAGTLGNKEKLWRMWSVVVNPLTDTVMQTNEVNQGDALEHNFSAVHTALMLPVTHLLPGQALSQMTQKSMLASWSRLYTVFARCSALVATAEENICCEELCVKMAATLDRQALAVPSTLEAVANILLFIIENADFSPYSPQFQQKMKSPHTPLTWVRKKSKALGNLSTYQTLLVRSLEAFTALEAPDASTEGTGVALVCVLSTLFTNLALATAIQEALSSLNQPLTVLYEQAGRTKNDLKFSPNLGTKLERLLGEVLGGLQTRSALAYDDELLALLSPLLCVLFPHKSKHIRSLVTQFWNATFAHTAVLTYPEELKPVLSQVKQKTPIILPGFEAVDIPDEHSGQYSSESSQLETKLSGMQVMSAGKRNSMLGRAGELKENNSKTSSKPVSTKLDFGSPKPPRREVLEEEASIDFVFIPPETKERVLTEHQKEVKRTKRVDIPAMYNNLDASLDATVFSQYTQSQEESQDKLSSDEKAENVAEDEVKAEVQEEEDMEVEDAPDIPTKETQEYISPTATDNMAQEPPQEEEESAQEEEEPAQEIIPESADVSVEEDVSMEEPATEPREGTSPNVSSSSDMVSGTPQKQNSRRQSFITLEKYPEGKPASGTSFTGPHTRTSNSQEPSSRASLTEAGTDSQASQETKQARPKSSKKILPENESPQQEKGEPLEDKDESEVKPEIRPSEGTEDEDDVIPDTQAEVEKETPAIEENIEINSQEEESESPIEDSQLSQATLSPGGELRRSGRRRSKPLRPGQTLEDKKGKDKLRRKDQPGEEMSQTKTTPVNQTDRQTQGGSSRRSKLAIEIEEDGKDKYRKRASKDESELSQTNSPMATPSPATGTNSQSPGMSTRRSKLVSDSEELAKDKRKRRGVPEDELNQSDSRTDTASDTDSLSQGRRSLRRKLAVEAKEDGKPKRGSRTQKEEDEQSRKESNKPSQQESQSQGKASRRSKPVSLSEEFDLIDQVKRVGEDAEQSQIDTQITTPSPAAQTDSQSHGKSSRRSKLVSDSEELILTDKRKRKGGTEDQLSQSESQTNTPSSATQQDSHSQGRASRRSKVTESEDKSQNMVNDSTEKDVIQTDSQVTPSGASQTESKLKGKPGRRSKVVEKQSKSSSSPSHTSTTESESPQMADVAVAQESSQGRGRYTRRRVSQGLLCNIENSESDASETREDVQKPKKRGRKPKSSVSLPSPLTSGSGKPGTDQEIPMDSSESSQKIDSQNTPSDTLEIKTPKGDEDSLKTEELLLLRPPLAIIEQSDTETEMDVQSDMVKAVDTIKIKTPKGDDSPLKTEELLLLRPPLAIIEQSDTETEMDVQSDMVKAVDTIKIKTPKGDDSPLKTEDLMPPLDQSDTETEMEMQGELVEAVDFCLSEKAGSENAKPSPPLDPAVEPDLELKSKHVCLSPQSKQKPSIGKSNLDTASSDECDLSDAPADDRTPQPLNSLLHTDSEPANSPVPSSPEVNAVSDDSVFLEPNTLCTPPLPTDALPSETVEKLCLSLQVSESSEEKVLDMPEPVGVLSEEVTEEQDEDKENVQPKSTSVIDTNVLEEDQQDLEEEEIDMSLGQTHPDCDNALDEEQQEEQYTSIKESQPECDNTSARTREEKAEADVDRAITPLQDITPLQERPKTDEASGLECEEEDEGTQIDNNDLPLGAIDSVALLTDPHEVPVPLPTTSKDVCQDSPPKLKSIDAVLGLEVGQSPNSGKTRGVWSPSASPSTSILKKGQKRTLEEEETPSPLIKSRRVSFADPIQHQELADDIDRRSPVIRTSSPRSKMTSSIPQPKYITTPTKGLLILSPRNLRSPGYKSSKKCLISEMSQERRPIPKDCVYPALVSCSTPVEAVLPQIYSNMWPRGFGQLVRARNIKTVGDLSALTPTDIKALPIRSPKIANVKKALKTYHEQQRKGRGDELKSFDEMERMTSELEEPNIPQNMEEEEKSSGEALATALLDEPAAMALDLRPEQERPVVVDQRPEGLLSEVGALVARLTPEELGQCSPDQLVQLHEQLGGMMRTVVVQLQTRLCQKESAP